MPGAGSLNGCKLFSLLRIKGYTIFLTGPKKMRIIIIYLLKGERNLMRVSRLFIVYKWKDVPVLQ